MIGVMILTQKELRKAATMLADMPRAKGLSQRLARAAEHTALKVKHERPPVTLANHGELYCIPCMLNGRVDGYTCLGFDVAIERANGYYEWLKAEGQDVEPYDISLRGTVAGYYEYRRLADRASAYNVRTGKKCLSELSPQLIGLEGKRVEVVVYGETRRFIVGRSTGWSPIHLEIANSRSTGGGAASRRYDSVRQV